MSRYSVDHMLWSAVSGVQVRAIVLAFVSTHRGEWLPSVGHFGVLEFLSVRFVLFV
jgi:hypothetical protein